MQEAFKITDYERLLQKITYRVLRRVHAAGARSVQKEDIYQEAVVAWCKARDRWMPEHNVPFPVYLTRGVFNHLNRWVEHELREFQIAPFDLDNEIGKDSGAGNERLLHDVVPDPGLVPADIVVEEKDLWDRIMSEDNASLSDPTKRFLQLLANPPQILVDTLKGLRARADYAKERGMTGVVAPKHITASMVLDLMDCSRLDRAAIYREISDLSVKVGR